MPQPTSTTSQRLEVVDALRGFALIAIVLIHSIEHYNLFTEITWEPNWLKLLDDGVISTVWFLFAGKAYATFSLLFGFSFYIQMRNARRSGSDFRLRFAWRMLLLACFAQFHALFYDGDILLFYSVCGLILIPASSWKNRTILVVAGILLMQPLDWIHMIIAYINPDYIDTSSRFAAYGSQVDEAGMYGNLWQTMCENISNGQLYSNLWQIEAGRICQTPALFLLGMWLGRTEKFICSAESIRFWYRLLYASMILFIPFYALKTLVAPLSSNPTWHAHWSIAMGLPANFMIMTALVSVFVLFWFTACDHGYKFQRLSIAFGKMSLTNYITQSILGVAIFYNFGLGLYRFTGATLSLLIGIGIVTLLTYTSRVWLRNHKQGPLEYLWKKLTWINFRSETSTPSVAR